MAATIFKDLSLSFQPNPFTGDISTVTNENAVIQSLRNILLTDQFEIPFNSGFGGNIRGLLFELASPLVAAELRQRIRFAIENFEPRIELIDVNVTDDADNNRYNIQVTFTTVTSETPTTVSFFLKRVL